MIIMEAAFLALMVLLFFALRTFDSLVKIEYKRHNQDWIRDGRPKGFFWRAPGASLISGSVAAQKLSFLWLFRSPHWTDDDNEAKMYLKRLRRLVMLFYLGVVAWLVIIMSVKT
jgi:chromosome condensin MukBEF MukE localization factor